jgi:WD40 repeat protein
MRLWDVSTCSCISTIIGHSEPTYALLELPNGIIASGGGDELIKLWNFSSYLERADDNNGTTLREAGAACLGVLIEGGSGKVLALECVRDEAARLYGAGDHCYLLLSGNQDSTIRLWGVRLTPSGGVEMDSNLGATSVVVVDVAAACAATDIAKCDFVIDAAELRVEKAILRGHNGEVNCLRAFADGTTLASGSDDKTIRLWDLESRTCVKVLTGHQNWILGLQFLSDDETLVSSSRDHTIGFWQAPRKRFLLTRKISPRK